MSNKNAKTVLVAFKVEAELAELLSKLPNKSEFIRKAIAAQLGMACPLCHGKGMVHRALFKQFAPLIQAERQRACVGCGDDLMLPNDPGELAPEDRTRLEQFFHGGPLYCVTCFRTAPACEECGWHVDGERIAEHRKATHSARN